VQLVDAEQLAAFTRGHEGYEQARRDMLAQHDPEGLIRDHMRFLELSTVIPSSRDAAFARARLLLEDLAAAHKAAEGAHGG
jgi:hypothetical protein